MRRTLDRVAPAALLSGLLIGLNAAALAQAVGAMKMHVTIVETHDRLTPTPEFGIAKRIDLEIVLNANKHVEESSTHMDVTGSKPHFDERREQSASLGGTGRAVWHVLGENKLQRIGESYGQLMIWTVEITGARTCTVDVKYILKSGASFRKAKIAGTDIDGTFTVSKVQSASCSVE